MRFSVFSLTIIPINTIRSDQSEEKREAVRPSLPMPLLVPLLWLLLYTQYTGGGKTHFPSDPHHQYHHARRPRPAFQ
jgi:hypothetical protein